MSKIQEFHNWAKQFIAIQDSHVQEFLDSIEDLGLYEMKGLFSEKYQNRLGFSFALQAEKKVKYLHIPENNVICTYQLQCDNDAYGYGSGYG